MCVLGITNFLLPDVVAATTTTIFRDCFQAIMTNKQKNKKKNKKKTESTIVNTFTVIILLYEKKRLQKKRIKRTKEGRKARRRETSN